MSRLAPLFEKLKQEGRRAVIPYLVAGDPNEALTVPLMHALVDAGADIRNRRHGGFLSTSAVEFYSQ